MKNERKDIFENKKRQLHSASSLSGTINGTSSWLFI